MSRVVVARSLSASMVWVVTFWWSTRRLGHVWIV